MLGFVRRLARLRGPAGVVVLATGAGLLTGLVAAHAVLAAWTYRDASRRDLREPGRWALAVLVGGVFGFVPYVALQRSPGWRALLPGGRGGGAEDTTDEAVPEEEWADRDLEAADRDVETGEYDGTGRDVTTGEDDWPDRDVDAGGLEGPSTAGGRGPTAPDEGRGALPTAGRYGLKAARLGARGARWAGRRAAARMNNR